jgi:hypothetical protein
LEIIENFHTNARKVAGAAIPSSVLAAGFSSTGAKNFGSGFSSNFSPANNTLDTSSYGQSSYGTSVNIACLLQTDNERFSSLGLVR